MIESLLIIVVVELGIIIWLLNWPYAQARKAAEKLAAQETPSEKETRLQRDAWIANDPHWKDKK